MPFIDILTLDPERTAFLCMDFQRDMLGGSPLAPDTPDAQTRLHDALNNTAALLADARDAQLLVVHVRVAFRPGYPGVGPYSPMMNFMKTHSVLLEGTEGVAFADEVAPMEREPIVTKRGVGAFAGTDLGWILRAHHIDRILLTGLMTHYVVAGTAREAHDLGYGFVVVSDCVASATPERHDAALLDLAFLGDIATSEVVRQALA